MYMLFKNKRPVGNIKFDSYEKCRQWARKLARKQPMPTLIDEELEGVWAGDVADFGMALPVDVSRIMYRTPTLMDYGYSIRRI